MGAVIDPAVATRLRCLERAPPCRAPSPPGAVILAGCLRLCAERHPVRSRGQRRGCLVELRTADAGNSDARLVDRRRLTTYLGLHISGLGPKDDDGLPSWRNQFAVHFQMRFDADFGDYLCAIGRSSYGAQLGCLDRDKGGKSLRPELSNYKPEILEGYIEGQSLGGWVDLRLRRAVAASADPDLSGRRGVWGTVAKWHAAD